MTTNAPTDPAWHAAQQGIAEQWNRERSDALWKLAELVKAFECATPGGRWARDAAYEELRQQAVFAGLDASFNRDLRMDHEKAAAKKAAQRKGTR